MSETTPDPVSGRNNPFRSDEEQLEEITPDDGTNLPFLLEPDDSVDRNQPDDRV